MAESRRVTIYINGKEVANSIKAIRSESRKLRNELSNMTRGTDAYNRKVAELKKANAIVNDHNAKLRGTAGLWANMKTEVKQFGMMAIAYLGAGQLLSGIDNIIQRSAKLDDTFADVRKTTGLTLEEVKQLNEQLSKIDTRSSREELLGLATIAGKLGISGKDNLAEFVKSADMINVALGEDLGGNVEEVVRQLGTLTDLFGETAKLGAGEALNKTGSAINDLGASSKAKEKDIVDFTTAMGGIAPQANLQIDKILGLGATISNLGIESNVASTVFSQVLPRLFTDTAKYAEIAGVELDSFKDLLAEDTNEAMLVFLEGLQKNNGGLEELGTNLDNLGLDGKKAITVLGALGNNTELLREQQDLANQSYKDGISLITEFDIKNNTLAAVLEKLQKRIRSAFVSTEVTESLKRMAFWVQENFDGIVLWGRRLAKIVGVFITFKATLFAVNNAYKAAALLSAVYKTATIALAGAKALLTGNITRATAAQRMLNLTMSKNPLGIFISLVFAAAAAIFLFKTKTDDATDSQEKFNAAYEEGQRLLDNQTSLEDRMKTVEKLSKRQLEFLRDDVEQEIQANLKKDASILESTERNADKIKAAEQQKKDFLLKLENDLANAKDGLSAEIIEKQIEAIKAELDSKEQILYNDEGITTAQTEENRIRLENWKTMLEQKISKFKTSGSKITDEEKATTDKIIAERQRLLDEIDKLELDRLIKDSNDPELEAIESKWAERIEIYRTNFGLETEEIKRLEKLRNQELGDLRIKREAEYDEAAAKSIEKLADLQQEALFLTLDAEERAIVESLMNEEEKNLKILELLRKRTETELEIQKSKDLAAVTGLIGEKELREQIEANHNAKLLAMNDAYHKGVRENTKATTEVEKESFRDIAGATANFLGTIAGMMNRGTGEWKALKIAEATISMFTGMSTALEKGGVIGGIEAAGVFAAGTANIVSIMRTQIPDVPEQYYMGGYRQVRGGQDGRKYNAKMALNKNGGNVDAASLVLGGERGPEYWVNNDMMNIPSVANITNAMEMLRTKQISVPNFENIVQQVTVNRQFAKGGFDGGMPSYTESRSGKSNSGNDSLVLKEVLYYLKNPKPNAAIFDFDYYHKSNDLINKIQNDAAG